MAPQRAKRNHWLHLSWSHLSLPMILSIHVEKHTTDVAFGLQSDPVAGVSEGAPETMWILDLILFCVF